MRLQRRRKPKEKLGNLHLRGEKWLDKVGKHKTLMPYRKERSEVRSSGGESE
jgi:hypothetical protein